MIERAAGCLESGGRRLLRAPKTPLRSQRSLHSTFWSHGASDIDLPSWWILLLQLPSPGRNPQSPRCKTQDSSFLGPQDGGFMDFLYPAQSLAFVKRLAGRDASYHMTRHRKQPIQQRSRAYTSHADPGQGLADKSLKEAEPETAMTKPTPGEETRQRLNVLLANENLSANYEDLWQTYLRLQAMSISLPPEELIKMLRCLSSSSRKLDIERSLLLFASIPTQERRAIHYSHAVAAALSQSDPENAILIHREALSRVPGSVGTSAILRYTAQREQWQLAVDIWHRYWYHKRFERPDIWTGVNTLPLPDMIDNAISAADFAIQAAESMGQDTALAARDFALQIAMRSFNVRGTMFDRHKHHVLFEKAKALKEPSIELYKAAILQLLSVDSRDHGRAAISRYRDLRRDPVLVPDKTLLNAILDRLVKVKSNTGMFMMLEDYRRYYGGPTSSALHRIISELARHGQSDVVQNLFDEFCTRFGTPRNSHLCNSMLYVYFRRAETKSIVQTFEHLRQSLGIVHDLQAYNLVIATFARVGDCDGALTWFNRLAEIEMKPNAQSYLPLISMYAKRGDLEAVASLFQQSRDEGVKTTLAMIDNLVMAQINNHQLDNVERTIEEALSMDLKGSRTRMWNQLINAYAMQSDLNKVANIYRRMQEAGVLLDSMTYAALMQSLCMAKQPDAAKKILQVVMPSSGIRASPLHYAIVMGGYLTVGNSGQVFALYNRMLKRNVKSTPSTQSALLKGAASVDIKQCAAEGMEGEPANFTRAQEILEQILANMDPMELSGNEPIRGFGNTNMDEAYSSSYFSYLIFLYGRRKNFDKVSELYQRYTATAQKLRPDAQVSPPLQMLSALMVTHLQAQDHEEVERCWYLALDKAEKLSRRSKAPKSSEAGWVLPARRFILDILLLHYMISLEKQGRPDDIIATIRDLHTSGYALTSKSWNAYIQTLARNGQEALAYELCEKELMDGWQGWAAMGGTWSLPSKFRVMAPSRLQPNKRMPSYPTLVHLAGAYLDAQSGGQARLEDLVRLAPRTVDAVRNMPKRDDELQTSILRRY